MSVKEKVFYFILLMIVYDAGSFYVKVSNNQNVEPDIKLLYF